MTHEPLRWTIFQASTEFDVDRNTLTKRLKRADIRPGEDGRFSTGQIVAAIFDDKHSQEVRKLTEEADALALKNKQTRSELIELPVVEQAWGEITENIRTRFMSLPTKLESRLGLTTGQREIAEAEVDEILSELSKKMDYDNKPDGEESEESSE